MSKRERALWDAATLAELGRAARDFDSVAEIYDRGLLGVPSVPGIFVAAMPSRRDKALDVGCGTGRVVGALAKHFKMVVGIDVSPRMIRLARERMAALGVTNAECNVMDLRDIRFPTEHFDYVISGTALHHVEDLDGALLELGRVLRAGGRLIFRDIVREGMTGRAPVIAAYLVASISMAREVVSLGWHQALRRFRARLNKSWLAHQRRERFIDRSTLRRLCSTVLREASVHFLLSEYCLTRLVELRWDKPGHPV